MCVSPYLDHALQSQRQELCSDDHTLLKILSIHELVDKEHHLGLQIPVAIRGTKQSHEALVAKHFDVLVHFEVIQRV